MNYFHVSIFLCALSLHAADTPSQGVSKLSTIILRPQSVDLSQVEYVPFPQTEGDEEGSTDSRSSLSTVVLHPQSVDFSQAEYVAFPQNEND